jgi:succinyl-CoA synthetase beta subunit
MSRTLSESDSKTMLREYGIPFLPEVLVTDIELVEDALSGVPGPYAAKLCGENISHKSERGLVRLGINGVNAVKESCRELLGASRPEDCATGVLVAPMATGLREFIAGVSVDPVFGPTIVFGLGGVLAEAIADVTVRLAPIRRFDALDMLSSLRCRALLEPFRGEPAVNLEAVADLLCSLSDAAINIDGLRSIDVNPVMIVNGLPIALDALVELSDAETES